MADLPKIKDAVIAAYKEKHRDLESIKVSSITKDVLEGNLVAVEFKTKNWENEQLCFVDEKDGGLSPIIFESETELARFINNRAKLEPFMERFFQLMERFFQPNMVAGFVFVIFALALIVGLFSQQVNAAVLTVIGGVVGSAGTYFYLRARNG